MFHQLVTLASQVLPVEPDDNTLHFISIFWFLRMFIYVLRTLQVIMIKYYILDPLHR